MCCVVFKVSVVSDEFYLVFKIGVVSLGRGGIVFHVDKTISHAVSKISVVVVVSDGTIFHVALKINPVTVVTVKIIFYIL